MLISDWSSDVCSSDLRFTPLPTVARGAPQGKMKPRLQTSLGQQLVLTPQLRQALHLLQLSALELESAINDAVETEPLLAWDDSEPLRVTDGRGVAQDAGASEATDTEIRAADWRAGGRTAGGRTSE